MFDKDAKNYHVWSYRQWLVRKFGLWDGGELEEVERLLRRDVRNNSAWNHRWFLVFGRGQEVGQDVWDREFDFVKEAIRMAPQNESPWNYLRGLMKRSKKPWKEQITFVEEFAGLAEGTRVRSSHALDILATAYAEESTRKDEAVQALDLLANKYDPIRANYWNYRKSLLEQDVGGVR
jgi:protein farnesyltransferase/geranylgeranyltransferase type-1 subunit alpha